MENRNTSFGIKRSVINLFHKIMLIAILHSSFVAPSQNLIIGYLNYKEPLSYKGSQLVDGNASANQLLQNQTMADANLLTANEATHLESKKVKIDKPELKNHYTIDSDLAIGFIGVSKDKPLDNPKDNLFKVYLKELPNANSKVYLTYELFGAQDYTAVSRSVNDRLATGGYVVKNQMGWSTQKEEIDAHWLKTGENKVMFGIPLGANYQYQIKNLKIEVDGSDESNLQSNLIVHNPLVTYFKNNEIYLKGFIRSKTSGEVKVFFEDNLVVTNDGEFEGFLKLTDEVKKRHFAIIKAFDSKGLLGQEIVSLDNLIEADRTFSLDDTEKSTTTIIKAYQPALLEADGAIVAFKDSSLVEDKEISITKLRSIDIAPMASGMINVTKGGLGYRFLPDGTKFKNPVTISLAYDEKMLPKGYSVNDIKTFYFNTDSKSWVAIARDTINKTDKMILSQTNHFTDYVNGIIQTPESPETAGFTPTMMNDIKAADPSSEMTIISPPEVSQKGEASISYPIKIPAGRKGMQPQLTVNYSNDGGNSWLGQGWNLNVPAITIDTRWGVPVHDPVHESDIYSMNGEQLMYPKVENKDGVFVDWMPNRHFDYSTSSTIYSTLDRERLTGADAIFTPRKQGSFAKIERLGNNPTEYYWKVTGTDGTISWYGGKTARDVSDGNAVIKNADKNIVHWGLFMTEDVHGNCIKYYYSNYELNGQSGHNANLNGGRIFQISFIKYNGYNDSDYKYQVDFKTDGSIREDVAINARLGVKQIEPYFLYDVTVRNLGNGEVVRKYRFNTGYGKFGKGRLNSVSELDKNDDEFYKHTFEYYMDIPDNNGEIYFSSGVDVNVCNDEYVPCRDRDGDKICDENDLCPDVPGSITNNGCPIGNYPCYQVHFNDRDQYFNQGFSAYVNGVLLPGSPFATFQSFISAMQIHHPTANYVYSGYDVSTLTITNTSINYSTLVLVSPFNGTRNIQFINCGSNSGETKCYTTTIPSGGVFNIMVSQGVYVSVNGVLLPGSPFNSVSGIVSAMQVFHPTTTYNGPTHTLTVSNTTNEYIILKIISQTDAVWDCPFKECTNGKTGKGNDYGKFFKDLSDSYTYTFEGTIPLDDDFECPSFLNYDFLIQGHMPSFDTALSPLGTSITNAENKALYLGVGVGCKWYTKSTTFGVQWTWSKDSSKAKTALTDINGDGLEDVVIDENGFLYYKPHQVIRTYDEDNQPVISHNFGAKLPISGINNFYNAYGRSKSRNFQVTFGVRRVGGFLGKDKSSSESTTNVYFTDGNGDGLMDIVKNGVVYFNRLDGNGYPMFNAESEETENMVIVAEPAQVNEPGAEPDEFTIPAYDVVKVWEAPEDGTIKIDNTITLTDTTKEAVVTIEKGEYIPPIPVKCYTVSFPLPTVSFKEFAMDMFDGIFFYTRVSPTQVTLELKKYITNGTTNYPPLSTLFMSNGDQPSGYRNDCQNYAFVNPIWLHNDANTDYITSNDFVARHDALMTQIENSNVNTTWTYINDYYAAQRPIGTQYGCSVSSIQDCVFFNGSLISSSINTLEREYAWTHEGTGFPLNSDCVQGNTPPSYVAQTQTFDFEQTTSTIPTVVSINNTQISGTAYNLSITAQYNNFVTLIHNLYPGSIITKANGTITVTINNTTQILNTITLSGTGNNTPNTYNFSEINCSGSLRQNITAVKGNEKDWASYNFSKEEMEVVKKKFIAEGSELKRLKSLEEKLSKDKSLTEYFTSDFIKNKYESAKQNQIASQQWLDDYYKKFEEAQQQSFAIANRSVNQLTCVETASNLCLLFGDNLNSTHTTVTNTIDHNSPACDSQAGVLAVRKGDRIYFRTHSVANGNPPVDWNPKVTYMSGDIVGVDDQNDLPLDESSYSDGFILSKFQPTPFPGSSGTVSITWPTLIFDPAHFPSDDVKFEVIRKSIAADAAETESIPVVLYSQTVSSNPANPTANQFLVPSGTLSGLTITSPLPNDATLQSDFFYFKVSSSSNVDWKGMKWEPTMQCTIQSQVIGENGPEGTLTRNETIYPIVDYSIYKSYECSPKYTLFDTNQMNLGTQLSIRPYLTGVFSNSDNDGTIWFVVKKNGRLVGKKEITISHNFANQIQVNFNNTPISLVGNTGLIEIGFYCDESALYDGQTSLLTKLALATNPTAVIFVNNNTTSPHTVPKSAVNLYQKPNQKFGPMLRQWGQFMYNPSIVTGTTVTPYGNLIKESALVYDQSLADAINATVDYLNSNAETLDEANLNSIEQNNLSLYNQPLLVATTSKTKDSNNILYERWVGLHEENYASEMSCKAATMEQSFGAGYVGESYQYQDVLQTGAYGINKISKGKNDNFSGGASLNVGVTSVGANGSKTLSGNNKTLTEYIDFNGDRYPDLVTSEQIQFTKKIGGLFSPIARTGELSIATSSSIGIGAQGSFSKGGDDGGSTKSEGNSLARFEGFKGNSGGGLSVNFSTGDSKTNRMWTDINGDGLADLLEKDGAGTIAVTLNYGYSSDTNNYSWNLNHLFDSKTSNIAGGVGVNKWNGSFEAGISLTSAWNSSQGTLNDMNGDGLLDYISSNDDGISVRINQGNKFVNFDQQWSTRNLNRESVTVGATANVTASASLVWYIPMGFWVLCLKLPTVSVSHTLGSTTTNKTKKTITDFDGDGYSDIVEQITNNTLRVYSSTIRRTDMLKSVTNPLGGKFTIDYKVQPVDYGNSSAKWIMSDLEVQDGYDKVNDGRDVYKKHFIYEKGKYDRREREFYGYETVKVQDYAMDNDNQPTTVYRTSVSKYHNESYFLNGLLKESFVCKGSNETQIFSRMENKYEIRQLNGDNSEITPTLLPPNFDVGGKEGRKSAAVLMVQTYNYLHELSPSPQLITKVVMNYDVKGRVEIYENHGNINDLADDYTTKISYHDDSALLAKNIINIPKTLNVSDMDGLKRNRSTEVEVTNGNINSITALIDNTTTIEEAQTSMKYDQYGNLTDIYYPENQNGEILSYNYKYDDVYHKYIVQINDALGYTSTTDYNSNFDEVLLTVDMASNKMFYEYDTFGRNVKIIAPKELESGKPYTIQFEYFPSYQNVVNSGYKECVEEKLFTPFAITSHFDTHHPENDIQTVTFIDGLARAIQVKKDIQLNMGSTGSPDFIEAMSFSGKTMFDDFGRAIKQFHPYYEKKDCKTNLIVNEYESPYNSSTEYDELDRTIKAIDPEGNESTMQYSIDTDVDGTLAIKTKAIVDQNGSQNIITETYKDVSGKVISTKNIGDNDVWTRFKFNAIGELKSYQDADNMVTEYNYDLLGRKVLVNHPDNGTTSLVFDKANNMVKLQTANLSNNAALDPADRFIKYVYEFNQLREIKYPNNPDGSANISNVIYNYGTSGSETGRLVYQLDATGEQEFKYGNMGELIHNKRTVVGPNIPTRVFETDFEYDSWNRIRMMRYPDGEKIFYDYDLGGNMVKMTGEVEGNPYNYIDRIDYDYYEQRAYLLYGNKTETFYDYTPSLRRLGTLNVKTATGADLFYNKYDYDKVGNVLKLDNSAGATPNGMAGGYQHYFGYDTFNRLIKASGRFEGNQSVQEPLGNDYNASYELGMKYNDTHGIAQKNQKHYKNGNIFAANTYENGYSYYGGTHKLKRVTDSAGSGLVENFDYDANGNMTKREDNNGFSKQMLWDESNRLRVVNDNLGMQHYLYDASGERVLKANTDIENVYENGTLTNSSIAVNSYTSYPSAFIVVNHHGIYSKHYFAGSQRIVSRIGDQNADELFGVEGGAPKMDGNATGFDDKKLQKAQLTDLKQLAEKAGRKNIVVKTYKPYTYEEVQQLLDEENKETEKPKPAPQPFASLAPLYFYHPDHLGTSTALTDFNGDAYQFFLNLPFGETMSEQLPSSSTYQTAYKFNGKELDEETGLYYYGARYYDPRISIWYSVDAKSDEYLNWNPYNYALQNPIKYIDPDGKNPITGALVAAFLEITTQIGTNMLDKGMNFKTAIKNLDYSDIAWETGTGAITSALDGGAGKLAKYFMNKKNRKIAKFLFEQAMELVISSINEIGKDLSNGKNVDYGDQLVNALIETGLGSLLPDTEFFKKQTKKNNRKINNVSDKIEKLEKKQKERFKGKRYDKIEELKEKKNKLNTRNEILSAAEQLATDTYKGQILDEVIIIKDVIKK